MGLTREQIHALRESVKAGSFSQAWWKQLKKQINKLDLSHYQKIQVFMKIVEGLVDECVNHATSPSTIFIKT